MADNLLLPERAGGGVEGRGHFRGEIEGDVVRCGRGGVSLAAPKATPRLIIRSFIHSFIFFCPFYTHTHTQRRRASPPLRRGAGD